MRLMTRIDRQLSYGALFVALIILLVLGTIAQYRGVFSRDVVVSMESDRAGLTLTKGAPVKLHGVEIGRVGKVSVDGDGVRIRLELDPATADQVPANVTGQIVPPTAFGAKYVQLSMPESREPAIRAGATISASSVTTEIDEAFQNLAQVLEVARPAELNAALTAVATGVDQRGEVLGELVSTMDRYLFSFNPSLPRLASDIRRADEVFGTYAAARPDLVATLTQSGVISTAVVRQRASLQAFQASLSTFSNEADELLRRSEDGIVASLTLMEPVSRTLQRYSPGLPCLVLGLAVLNHSVEGAVGGLRPGINARTRLIPGRDPYAYPENLPVLGDDRGPRCYGLPYITPEEAVEEPPTMLTGANPHVGPRPTPPEALQETLLGLLAGGANFR